MTGDATGADRSGRAADAPPGQWQDEAGHRHDDRFADFTAELRMLAETLLERVEPALRRAAAEDRAEWSGCSWCPVCATAALLRGEHHDLVATIADHGTAIVTVLREALAGVPVEPVFAPGAEDSESRSAASDSGHDRARYVSIPVRLRT